MHRGVPFSISILTLMLVVIGLLSASLMALGWRSTSTLEETNVDLRMAMLDKVVGNWLTGGVRLSALVQRAFALTPTFTRGANAETEDEIVGAFDALLTDNAGVAAAYVGFADGKFIYVGRVALLSDALKADLGAPRDSVFLVRRIDGPAGARLERVHFIAEGGGRTAITSRPGDFDPRSRPWYGEALAARRPIVTEPYAFALTDTTGVSVATPIGEQTGVIGFDFTLTNLSRVTAEQKITRNSLILIATAAGNVLADSSECRPGEAWCTAAEPAVREQLQQDLIEAARRGDDRLDVRRTIAGRSWEILINPMPPVFNERFFIGAAVPVEEMTEQSSRLIFEAAALASVVILIAIAAILASSLLLSSAIKRVVAKTARIRDLDFTDRQPVTSRIREVLQLSDSLEHLRDGLEVFGHYVAKDLVRQIMRSPAAAGVGGQRRDVTVMFSDIEGFSRISEGMPPELLTSRLSRYFDALAQPVALNKGTIDKFIGDSIMAFWNAPERDDRHVEHACRAAIAAAAAGRALAAKWAGRGRPSFRTRFGIHTGLAVIGNVGARDHFNYTLVGAVANQASRLEGLNKMYGTEILTSGDVVQVVREAFVWRQIDRVIPAGTSEPLDVFELFSERSDESSDIFLSLWNEGRQAYVRGDFVRAEDRFRAAARRLPDDGPCKVMLERCRQFLAAGPRPGWDGVWQFETK